MSIVNNKIYVPNTGSRFDASQQNLNSQSSGDLLKEDFQQQFHQQFRQKSEDHDGFHQMMRQAFSDSNKTSSNKGTTYNYEGAEALRKKVLADDLSWLPKVEVLSGSEFSQAQLFHQGQSSGSESFLGAFGDNTIFLNESILSDPTLALRVYSEEAGHAIDKFLNQERDTIGDEGAIFSKLLMNESLSAEQMQVLKSENDHGKLAGVDVEFLSDSKADSVISNINADRIAKADKTNAANAAAAPEGKEIEKVEPKLLTAKEEKDARDIYTQVKAEGKTDEQAASLTTHLMKPKNSDVRNKLRSEEAMAELASGKTLAEVVTDIETSKDLNGISKGFGTVIKTLKDSGIDIPNKEAALLILENGKTVVDVLALNVGGKDAKALGLAESIKLVTKQTGKTFSQIMEDMGKGDLSGFGAVMTDIGATYHSVITENDNIKTWAASTHLAGSHIVAMGQATGNAKMVATGKIVLGGAAFMGSWDFEVDGKPAATAITRTGDGVAFLGTGFSAIGELIGDKGLTNVGKYLTTGSKLSGPINTLHKLYTTEINFEEVGIVAGEVQGNINTDTAFDTGVGLVATGLDLGAMVIGDDDKETAKILGQTSDMLTSSYGLFEAITDGGTATDIASTGIAVVMEVLEIAGVEIPPKLQELISAGLSGLAASNAEGLGASAAVEFLTPYIVSLGESLGIQLTEKGVSEALGVVGDAFGYAAAVYKIVMVGFDIAKIAENDQLTDAQKITESTYALSDTLLTIGLSMVTNPVGWVVLALSGDLNIHGSLFDMTQNGLTRRNVTRLHFGALADILFPPRDPNVWINTFSPDGQAPAFDEEGFYMDTGNKSVSLWIESPFGMTRMSMHELDIKEDARMDMIDKYKPLFKQIKTTDDNLANAFNLADEQNGEAGRSMTIFRSSLENSNEIKKQDGDIADGMDGPEMIDYRYGQIADRVADSGRGSKAGIAFNAWLDGIDKKVIDDSGDTFSSADIIAKVPTLLTMSPEVIERLLNTVEPGTLEHVVTQLSSTVGSYLDALSNPLIQDPAMNEHQTLDFVFEKLGLTEDYRFAVAPDTEGIPQRVKDFVSHLNEMEGHGTVKLMGQGVQMGKDPEKNYQLIVNGELDAYRFVDGDTPHFMKMSRAVVDLSGDFGDWPPEGVVDWSPLVADKNANPLHNGTELIRQGDLQWIKPYDPSTKEGLTDSEKKGLKKAEALTAELQNKGKDVKLLGVSKFDGHFEVLVEGKQHAYKLEDGGDRFVQVSQRNLQTDIPGNVQKFHANLNRVREKEGKEAAQLVGRSEDGKTYQLKVDGELDTYRYVEDIETKIDYSTGIAVSKTVDKSYYGKVSRTEVNADWPPQHAVNWSDPEFLASREGNLVQWVKPDASLSTDEKNGLDQAKKLEWDYQTNGQDVKVLGVSKYKGHFEVLVEGKQHAYKLVEDKDSGGLKFVQATQTKLYAKASSDPATPEAPETTLPLADGNAALMAGNYQGVIDYVNQNPSSGADQQILYTYKRSAEHGLELDKAIAKGDYGEIASKLKLVSEELQLVAPELAKYYKTGTALASEADIIIKSVLSGNYTLANTMSKAFLETIGEHPEFKEKFHLAVDLARYVVDVSNIYSAGNLLDAAKKSEEYAKTLPADELKAAFSNIANNIRNEQSGGILITAGNTALMEGNYQGIINYVEATVGPNTKSDQQVIDTYQDAAQIGLKIKAAMKQEDYTTAAILYGFMADKLQPLTPEVADYYRVSEKLANDASSIISSVKSGDYTQATSSAKAFLATLDSNPDRESEFGKVMPLVRNVVAISDSYASGNLIEAAQLAAAYAETLPASDPLKTEFTKIAENIRLEQTTAA
jgi:hypothetical protein